MRKPFLIPGKPLEPNRRYDLFTIEEGIKSKSEKVLEEMLESEDPDKTYYKYFRGLEVGKFATVASKTGIISKIITIGKRLLVWLEIPLTRVIVTGQSRNLMVINYGIELPIK